MSQLIRVFCTSFVLWAIAPSYAQAADREYWKGERADTVKTFRHRTGDDWVAHWYEPGGLLSSTKHGPYVKCTEVKRNSDYIELVETDTPSLRYRIYDKKAESYIDGKWKTWATDGEWTSPP